MITQPDNRNPYRPWIQDNRDQNESRDHKSPKQTRLEMNSIWHGRLIAPLHAESQGDWYWQNAGYQAPPENAISEQEAIRIAMESIELEGSVSPQVICCDHKGTPIYKVRLSIYFYGNEISATYDAIWCVEMDCVTGEVIDKREYRYAESDSMMMYVPFSVLDQMPTLSQGSGNG